MWSAASSKKTPVDKTPTELFMQIATNLGLVARGVVVFI